MRFNGGAFANLRFVMSVKLLSETEQKMEYIEGNQQSRLAWVVDQHRVYDRGDTIVHHSRKGIRRGLITYQKLAVVGENRMQREVL